LSGFPVYAIVGGLVLAEDVVLVGLLVPGETAAILGGVAASRGQVDLVTLIIVVIMGAIVGDSLGYAVGDRYGVRLAKTRMLRRRSAQIERGRELLARRGGTAVITGRFLPFLRALMPFLAGGSHLSYRRFLLFDIPSAAVWGAGSVLLGYVAGNSYRAVEHALGAVTTAIIAVIVVGLVVAWVIRRRRRARAAGNRRLPQRTGRA
jgi:membrane protein DedA with SNARE-associated domain